MTITPNADRVLIEVIPLTGDMAKKNNLFIPHSAIDKVQRPKGIIKKVGPGKYAPNGTLIPMFAREGDVAVYTKTSKAIEIEIDGKDHLIIPESEILWFEDKEEEEGITPEITSMMQDIDNSLKRSHNQHPSYGGVALLGNKNEK